jgi:hypothetical protein
MAELNKDFDLRISFDEPNGYEDMVAEIYYKDQFLCVVSQEKGYQSLDIEIASNSNADSWQFKLSDFEQVIEKAKIRLWELRKTQ